MTAADCARELVAAARQTGSVAHARWSTFARQGVDSVIEFGPGRVLTGLMKRIDRSLAVRNVSDMAQRFGDVRCAYPTLTA